MTVKLPNAIETELVLKIAEGLQDYPIKNSYTLISDFVWAEKLAENLPEDAKEKIDRYIGERGLSRFIMSEIDMRRDRISERQEIIAGKPPSQLSFISNSFQFSRDLVAKLKTLPARYRLTSALPEPFSSSLHANIPKSVSMPANITLSTGDGIPQPFPVNSQYSTVDDNLFHDWIMDEKSDRQIKKERIYLSMTIVGYASPASSSVIGRQFEDHIRTFFGASLAVGLMEYGFSGQAAKLPYIMIHDEETREILTTEPLEDDLLEKQYQFSSEKFAKRNEENVISAYNSAIRKIGTVYNDNLDCRRLFSACIWFYRAKVNRRPLDALLQATIAIEVMLGDRKAAEGIGLTNLLASRCAYLLGRSSSHRSDIENKFRRVYELRSQIVHEGRHVLRTADRATIQMANSLCASIINRELNIRAIPMYN